MTADPFDDLYRELILDHYRRPRNHGEHPAAPVRVEGVNPVCGDEIHLDLDLEGGVVRNISFWGQGCSISQSSASMLTESVKGQPLDRVRDTTAKVRAMLVDGALPSADLGDLAALEGVSKLPVRVKCELLSWNVLELGLKQATPAASGGQA